MMHLSNTLSDDEFIKRRIECAKSGTIVDLTVEGSNRLDKFIDDKRFNEIFQFKKGDVVEVISPVYISLGEKIKEGEMVTILHRAISHNNRRWYSVRLRNGVSTVHNEEKCFAFPLEIQEISTNEIADILEG